MIHSDKPDLKITSASTGIRTIKSFMNKSLSFESEEKVPNEDNVNLSNDCINSRKCKKKLNKFLVHRTIFRGMSKYYKVKFAKISKYWQKKKGKKQKVEPMKNLVQKFIAQEFGNVKYGDYKILEKELLEPIMVVLHSHRYKKQEEFTENIDFSIVRDLLYSYSTEAYLKFISNPLYAFLMHHFCENDRVSFLNSPEIKEQEGFKEKLEVELDTI